MRQRGFTLMELLMVISIIMVLAGLILGAVAMVKRQARDVQCRNNLQQIGIGITGFQQENNNHFPVDLGKLFDANQSLANENRKVLICPFDASKGVGPDSQYFGRPSQWGSIAELYLYGCSYLFEACSTLLGPTALEWYTNPPVRDSPTSPTKKWWEMGWTTWSDAKVYSLKHGNTGGLPYNPRDFPIVRCFFHGKWDKTYGNAQPKAVLNLAWDMSLFVSIPAWEDQVKAP